MRIVFIGAVDFSAHCLEEVLRRGRSPRAVRRWAARVLGVRRVLACEVPSETDAGSPVSAPSFVPNVFIDVSGTIERKLEILSLYQSEVQPEPFPRALSTVSALARHRGATIGGVEYAEAFMLLREIA